MRETSRVTPASKSALFKQTASSSRQGISDKNLSTCVLGNRRQCKEKPIRGRTQQTKPTWHDASRQINQHSNESRCRKKIWNRYCRSLLLLRLVGSLLHHTVAGKDTHTRKRTSATVRKNTSHPTFPCPRCNRHGREPHHALTSIVFHLTVNTTCSWPSFEFSSLLEGGQQNCLHQKARSHWTTYTHTEHETTQHPTHHHHHIARTSTACAPQRVRFLLVNRRGRVCACTCPRPLLCANANPPLSCVGLLRAQTTLVRANIRTGANLLHLRLNRLPPSSLPRGRCPPAPSTGQVVIITQIIIVVHASSRA